MCRKFFHRAVKHETEILYTCKQEHTRILARVWYLTPFPTFHHHHCLLGRHCVWITKSLGVSTILDGQTSDCTGGFCPLDWRPRNTMKHQRVSENGRFFFCCLHFVSNAAGNVKTCSIYRGGVSDEKSVPLVSPPASGSVYVSLCSEAVQKRDHNNFTNASCFGRMPEISEDNCPFARCSPSLLVPWFVVSTRSAKQPMGFSTWQRREELMFPTLIQTFVQLGPPQFDTGCRRLWASLEPKKFGIWQRAMDVTFNRVKWRLNTAHHFECRWKAAYLLSWSKGSKMTSIWSDKILYQWREFAETRVAWVKMICLSDF